MEASQANFGMIPNLHKILAEAPATYEAYNQTISLFMRNTSLSPVEQQVVFMTSNFENNCHYCVPGHTWMMKASNWQITIRRAHSDRPADRVHLVERIGLLAIIILGESMIAMVGALSDQSWQMNHLATSVTGFLLIGAIWWVYFDSFPILERAKRLTSSNTLIFTHLLLCMGLLILANMIRHAILGDLDQFTFGLLSITGLLLFYLGKQIPYWYAFPPWRSAIVTNTLVCVSITVASSFLPDLAYSLMGMTFGMLVYVWLTFKRILSVNVDEYLDPEHH